MEKKETFTGSQQTIAIIRVSVVSVNSNRILVRKENRMVLVLDTNCIMVQMFNSNERERESKKQTS